MYLNLIFIGSRFGDDFGIKPEHIPAHRERGAIFVAKDDREKIRFLMLYTTINPEEVVVR